MKCCWNYKSGKNEDGRFGWGFAFLSGGRLLENGSVLDYISCAFLFQAAAPKSLCARIQVLPSLFPCNSCLYKTCLHYHWCKQAWLLISVIFLQIFYKLSSCFWYGAGYIRLRCCCCLCPFKGRFLRHSWYSTFLCFSPT